MSRAVLLLRRDLLPHFAGPNSGFPNWNCVVYTTYSQARTCAPPEQLGEELEHLGCSPTHGLLAVALTLMMFTRRSVADSQFSCRQREAFNMRR